jgi:hypothetical protein
MIRYLLLILVSTQLSAQSVSKIDALNNYVHFTNDCIHGLTISHLMLQSFNNEVNALVDATENFAFKNSDFGRDIYSDESYYEHRGLSPERLLPKMIKEGKVLGADAKKLDDLTSKFFKLCKRLNELRFETGDYIEQHDIKSKTHLDAVYKKLENAVKMFDEVYVLRNALEKQTNQLKSKYESKSNASFYKTQKTYHDAVITALKDIRAKETRSIKVRSLNLSRAATGIKNTSDDLKQIKIIADKSSRYVRQFYQDGSVPKNYEAYGKFYYYYHIMITECLNTVSPGTAYRANAIMTDKNIQKLHFLQMPPIFKVLYPRKLKKPDEISSTDTYIEEIPVMLKERKIVNNGRIIKADRKLFEIEFFDNMMLDGDILSVNYNGDWIMEKKSLEKFPTKLKFHLNDTGINYILLHADNEGVVPPNTMGIAYFYKGKKKTVFLESNMETSEVIEIEYEH